MTNVAVRSLTIHTMARKPGERAPPRCSGSRGSRARKVHARRRAGAEPPRAAGKQVEVLDGDVVRTHLSKGLGFSREDRDLNVLRIAFVAHLLSRNGVTVVVSAISPYRATRDGARAA